MLQRRVRVRGRAGEAIKDGQTYVADTDVGKATSEAARDPVARAPEFFSPNPGNSSNPP